MRSPFKIKDGRKYLHVTSGLSIIRMEFLEKWRGDYGNAYCDAYLLEANNKGTDLHNYAACINQGSALDTSKVSAEMDDWIFNYQEWAFENIQEILMVEKGFYSEKYGIYGEVDLVAVLKGKKTPAIIDYKTGKHINRPIRYQLSGYKELLKENGVVVHDRIILPCRKKLIGPKGAEIRCDNKTHDSDFRMFIYACALYRDNISK